MSKLLLFIGGLQNDIEINTKKSGCWILKVGVNSVF